MNAEEVRPSNLQVYGAVIQRAAIILDRYLPPNAQLELAHHLRQGMPYVLAMLETACAPVLQEVNDLDVKSVMAHARDLSPDPEALEAVLDGVPYEEQEKLLRIVRYLLFFAKKIKNG